MAFRIRTFERGDAAAVTAIRSAVAPYLITTAESLLWRIDHAPPTERGRLLVAEVDGRIAGRAGARLEWETSLPGQGTFDVTVLPEHRGRGIGGALARAAEEHLRTVGAVTLRTLALDEDSGRFAERRGYRRRSTARFQELELAALPPLPRRPEGVELRSYEDYRLDPGPVHAVEAAAIADEPGDFPLDAVSYDGWLASEWENPLLDRELSTVAVVDGRAVAAVNIQSDGRSRIGSGMTGTLREYRGLGLAGYTKTAALHRARERGHTHAYTANDDTNAPMLAINDRLGYRPCGRQLVYAREP
ncbi:GNAT superfamily N-acetyltransferase [Spinactinospora alkalitolerans]|uniref:GNAT superfamily N-acetyltransferase n=1 Tax=Spinactinospora alkalitolerans TaxID=687207 RepID=A0A852TUW3_9ACTN|nr:GNAT family N-acetyltransferase [Spinactinospora alkalitolerans]NYE46583.1 GNAT superfamily N-acetyltransferase [Spinactinospora alkalitolerans]